MATETHNNICITICFKLPELLEELLAALAVAHGDRAQEQADALLALGGTTCLTLPVSYGLVCFLRHYMYNAVSLVCCIVRHF